MVEPRSLVDLLAGVENLMKASARIDDIGKDIDSVTRLIREKVARLMKESEKREGCDATLLLSHTNELAELLRTFRMKMEGMNW